MPHYTHYTQKQKFENLQKFDYGVQYLALCIKSLEESKDIKAEAIVIGLTKELATLKERMAALDKRLKEGPEKKARPGRLGTKYKKKTKPECEHRVWVAGNCQSCGVSSGDPSVADFFGREEA